MNKEMIAALPNFLTLVGLDEEPMGLHYTDEKPVEGFSPKPMDLPTREKELKNAIDWQAVFGQFSCVMGHIWRARKKRAVAYFFCRTIRMPRRRFLAGIQQAPGGNHYQLCIHRHPQLDGGGALLRLSRRPAAHFRICGPPTRPEILLCGQAHQPILGCRSAGTGHFFCAPGSAQRTAPVGGLRHQ
jgi:hypothetical protein